MRQSGWHGTGELILVLLLIITSSCAQAPRHAPALTQFYIIPEITYLREHPGPEEKVLSRLHRGDQMELVEAGESSWVRVQQVPGGQTGWVQRALLTREPIISTYYSVNLDKTTLRECPRHDCSSVQMLSRGDRVSKLAENYQGWWQVQALGSGSLGWLPAAAVTAELATGQPQQPAREYYYVAVSTLGLRATPWMQAEIVKTLRFNEQVQKISHNSQGWFKVRQPSSGALGWVSSRYLEPLPLRAPRLEGPVRSKPKPVKPRQEPTPEPEIM